MPLWVGFGCLALCGAGVFAKVGGILGFVTMRWGICWLDVVCVAGPARHGICCGVLSSPPPGSLLLGAVAPHPSSFSCVCGVLCRGGVSCGVSACFPLVFHGGCGQILANSVGLCGHLLGWGECAWAVSIFLVGASTREG